MHAVKVYEALSVIEEEEAYELAVEEVSGLELLVHAALSYKCIRP